MRINEVITEDANKGIWQSTKDTLSKFGKNKAVRIGGRALAPLGTALGAMAVPDDAYAAMKDYDKGDKVGAWLKGGQAAVNTAMIPTTIAALTPTPVAPFALAADAALGLTSAGLAGAEYVRDKYFPYKDKDIESTKSSSDKKVAPTDTPVTGKDNELDRVVALKNYKAGTDK
jgi:hypothetical protein